MTEEQRKDRNVFNDAFSVKRAKEIAQTCQRHRNGGGEGTRVISNQNQTVKVHVAHSHQQPACTSLSLPIKFTSDTVQRFLWNPEILE